MYIYIYLYVYDIHISHIYIHYLYPHLIQLFVYHFGERSDCKNVYSIHEFLIAN
jgi:hypothetical protein